MNEARRKGWFKALDNMAFDFRFGDRETQAKCFSALCEAVKVVICEFPADSYPIVPIETPAPAATTQQQPQQADPQPAATSKAEQQPTKEPSRMALYNRCNNYPTQCNLCSPNQQEKCEVEETYRH